MPAFSRVERTRVERPASHSTETSIDPDSSGMPCFSTPGWPLSTSAPAGRVPAVFDVPGDVGQGLEGKFAGTPSI